MTDLAARIQELKAEAKATESRRFELERQAHDCLQREEEIDRAIHALTIEWLKGRPPVERWQYWVERAKTYGVHIYYQEGHTEIVDPFGLDAEERKDYQDNYDRATLSDVPDESIILSVVSACEESALLG